MQGSTCETKPKIPSPPILTPGKSNLSIPAECQTISQQIESNKKQKDSLQKQLSGLTKGSAETKSELISQIRDLNKMITENEKKLNQCISQNAQNNSTATNLPTSSDGTDNTQGNNNTGAINQPLPSPQII